MSALEVACAVEGDYVPHSAAMLHSLLANRGSCEVRIHYMHGPDFQADAARRLEEMVVRDGGEISFLAVDDERCEGLPTRGFTGKATWYRIFLPELLGDVGRVISLDLDAIVTDSLAPLWATDLGGSPSRPSPTCSTADTSTGPRNWVWSRPSTSTPA